jgi:hypothetical protein
MSKLSAFAAVVALGGLLMPQPVVGAELSQPKRAHARVHRPAGIYCGCCGCLGVTFDYHRELRSTYGTQFDPRNFDQTEPYYYFGRVRAYPRFWVDRGPLESGY